MFTGILTAAKGFFSSFKLYIYIAIIAAAAAFWLTDRHAQYEKGIAYCEEKHQTADTKYVERQKEEQAKAAKEAVQTATDVAEHITSKEVEKPHEIEKTKKLAVAANKPASCDLSDDELRDITNAVSDSNK